MKRIISVAAVLLFLTLLVISQVTKSSRAQTQGNPSTSVTPTPPAASKGADSNVPFKYPLSCQGCHGPGKTLPYLAGELFHKEPHGAYDQSTHSKADQMGRKAANCVDCHAINGDLSTMLPKNDPKSTIHPSNIVRTCGKCHAEPSKSFHDSIHGNAQERGINTAATCADCHNSHNIFPANDSRSALSKLNTPETCGKCHSDIRNDFLVSSHGAAVQKGDDRAPVCTSCHTGVSHADAPVSTRDFAITIPQQCGKCHEAQAPTYRDTFHGQATALGLKPAAGCADCHTPHRNLPPADARSSVHQANLVQTCGACHKEANANFVAFDPHAEPKNPERSKLIYTVYTFMNTLLMSVFVFFGIHTLLWLQRSIVGALRGETKRIRDGELWVERFVKPHRFTHILIVVSFLMLAGTGLPLMFYYTDWGQNIVRGVGGLEVTRFMHRAFAVVTLVYAVYHLGYILWRRFAKGERVLGGPDSMMPRKKDLLDLYGMARWFFYIDKKPPKFDHWTYWEKFDYFAVFWGVPIIGLSGLMLWVPTFITRFLPGTFLNLAMIVHSDEALLAIGFIFTFHFFHNHLRPENFPLDTVIFTGKMPLERFKEERPEEYERLEKEGQLDSIIVAPPTRRERFVTTAFGAVTYLIGVFLIIAIFATLIVHR
jgi:cytochrome b subunit of formate dehydrogenase/nitrate/TMAO reductase-like tetraheme cytochrome c subunit